MIYILGIAPYEALAHAMETAAESFPMVQLDVYIGDLETGVEIVRAHEMDGYDCIISRGGTAELIQKITNIPVIKIQLSVFDVLHTIKLAENYSHMYAIVGFPGITEQAHTLCNLLQYDIDIFTTNNTEEIYKTLYNLQQKGYKMVVSDMATHTIARQIGMDAFLITSGAESLMSAIDKAVAFGTSIQHLRQENFFLRSISTLDDNQLIVLNKCGDVFYCANQLSPSKELLNLLRSHTADISPNTVAKFYDTSQDILYAISAKSLSLNNKVYYLFYCQISRIPLRLFNNKIRQYNKSECETLCINSFYSINGALGISECEISSIAKTNQTVIIIGEHGTGKSHLAYSIYLHSSWSNRPFTVIDCSSMDDRTWEFLCNNANSPLADHKCTVYFQNFESLSLEHCHELIALIQATALPKRERLLFSCNCLCNQAATHTSNLLCAKLECLSLYTSTLRSRSDEIPSLASLCIDNLNAEYIRQISGFEPGALKQLQSYDWPSNYRQFHNILSKLAATSTTTYIQSDTVAEVLAKERLASKPIASLTNDSQNDLLTLAEITQKAVLDALNRNNGNQSAAARQLGISRTTLWRYLNS